LEDFGSLALLFVPASTWLVVCLVFLPTTSGRIRFNWFRPEADFFLLGAFAA
jgi:hypothetical protein